MKGVCSIVTFPKMMHHHINKYEGPFDACTSCGFFHIRQYIDWNFTAFQHKFWWFGSALTNVMILGWWLSLQFKPSHKYSLGTHGSPCQFLVTLYIFLMSMIASTIIFFFFNSKREWERKVGEFKIQIHTKDEKWQLDPTFVEVKHLCLCYDN